MPLHTYKSNAHKALYKALQNIIDDGTIDEDTKD